MDDIAITILKAFPRSIYEKNLISNFVILVQIRNLPQNGLKRKVD